MKILVTGGAGFIGSALIRHLIKNTQYNVINIDNLTYAGNKTSLQEVESSSRYFFEKLNICDENSLNAVFKKYRPDIVMHLAAETHVDRSIDSPKDFIDTNIIGTYTLLEVSRNYWLKLNTNYKNKFRFHHISTDEVYGDLDEGEGFFDEDTAYDPSSPYSASKASSDHLVRAWGKTFGLPIIVTNCSNNYGPYHFPEKLIPLTIINALQGKNIPIYGKGTQIRDWLYVEDHVIALLDVIKKGKIGNSYNIGGHNEKRNIDVVRSICKLLDELAPNHPNGIESYEDLISFVNDRPGHDLRYAIDAKKIKDDLGWTPNETFESGLRKTVVWFLENKKWWHNLK